VTSAGPLLEALQHPLRREALRYLQQHGTGSASEIARDLGVRVGNLSYHVRRLAQLGLIEEIRAVRRRGALMHVFRTTSAYREAIAALLSDEIARLAELAQSDTGPVTVVDLDEEGVRALEREMTRVRARVRDLRHQSADRVERAGRAGRRFQATVLVAVTSRDAGTPTAPGG
jgi:DNA-binding transcriptional ArsR family regulator